MKKNMIIFLCFLFLIFNATSINAEQNVYKLTLADSTAPTGLRGDSVKILLEEIDKYTNGKVKIDVYWSEALLKANEMLAGVQNGITDIGYIGVNYYPTQLIALASPTVYVKGPVNFKYIYKIFTRLFEEIPEFSEELLSYNQKMIYFDMQLPMAITSRVPFTSFEDFKDKRIRASSKWYLAQLENAGSIPVSVAWGDCYLAYKLECLTLFILCMMLFIGLN